MNAPALLSFPLPMLTALLCLVIAGVAWRLDLGARRASILLAAVFGLGALQAFLVGLRFGYGTTAFIPVQRTLPLMLGPLLFTAFTALTVDGKAFPALLTRHMAAPVLILTLIWLVSPDLRLLDWAIAASYVFYILALARLWRGAPDSLVHVRIGLADRMAIWIFRAMCLLSFLLILDTAIAIDFAMNSGANATWLISVGTVPIVGVLLVLLATLPRILPQSPHRPPSTPTMVEAEVTDTATRIDALLTEDRLFLDPDLTVQRLARRLHLPARNVSTAINRTKGMNASQYVNTYRLAHAVDLLRTSSRSVKDIAEASGFLTRSNFYREFQRAHGVSPTEFRRSGAASEGD